MALLVFGFQNIYRFIYKQERYQNHGLIVCLYVTIQLICLFKLLAYIICACNIEKPQEL